MIAVAVEKFQLTDPNERKIVVSPTYTQPGGSLEPDELVQLSPELVIELWKEPYLINVVNDVPSHHPSGLPPPKSAHGGREISLDFAAPLTSLIPVLQRAFCTGDEIFCFKAMNPSGNVQGKSFRLNSILFTPFHFPFFLFPLLINVNLFPVRWLNPHKSLAEQKFQAHDWLILYPTKGMLKVFLIYK